MRGGLEPIAPLLVSQAGVLGSQPPVPVIALTGDDPAGAFPRRIASEIDTDGWAAAVGFVSSAYTLAVKADRRKLGRVFRGKIGGTLSYKLQWTS